MSEDSGTFLPAGSYIRIERDGFEPITAFFHAIDKDKEVLCLEDEEGRYLMKFPQEARLRILS